MVWLDQNVNRFPSRGFREWNIFKVFPFDLVLTPVWNRQALTNFIQCPCFNSRLGLPVDTLYRQRDFLAFERNTSLCQDWQSEGLFISLGCYDIISNISWIWPVVLEGIDLDPLTLWAYKLYRNCSQYNIPCKLRVAESASCFYSSVYMFRRISSTFEVQMEVMGAFTAIDTTAIVFCTILPLMVI